MLTIYAINLKSDTEITFNLNLVPNLCVGFIKTHLKTSSPFGIPVGEAVGIKLKACANAKEEKLVKSLKLTGRPLAVTFTIPILGMVIQVVEFWSGG